MKATCSPIELDKSKKVPKLLQEFIDLMEAYEAIDKAIALVSLHWDRNAYKTLEDERDSIKDILEDFVTNGNITADDLREAIKDDSN